ncbi:MAG: 4Fe-4S binding protein [Leptospiraceae bacterium]|nr:4Fe-4S binding protein [Leptospiraceae bacterium]
MGFYEFKKLLLRSETIDYSSQKPVHQNSRGIPMPVGLAKNDDCKSCSVCEDNCPTNAIQIISKKQIQFDYGSCTQCGLCAKLCPKDKIIDSGFIYNFSFHREELKVVYDGGEIFPKEFSVPVNVGRFQELTRENGFNYREVASGGNNSVECELGASFNNVFDSEGIGVRSVASPKHADAILYSGPPSINMESPLQDAWDTMPEPRALIACGTEAISGGLFTKGKTPKEPDLYIAGDPPRPDTILQAFRYLMGRFTFNYQKAIQERYKELKKTFKR